MMSPLSSPSNAFCVGNNYSKKKSNYLPDMVTSNSMHKLKTQQELLRHKLEYTMDDIFSNSQKDKIRAQEGRRNIQNKIKTEFETLK